MPVEKPGKLFPRLTPARRRQRAVRRYRSANSTSIVKACASCRNAAVSSAASAQDLAPRGVKDLREPRREAVEKLFDLNTTCVSG